MAEWPLGSRFTPLDMECHHINREVGEFAHKNVSAASNSMFSISMILLVLVTAAQNGHSVTSTASSPNEDTVFYRFSTSVKCLQNQLWKQGLGFLRRKKKKLSKTKCYITVDETHDSYAGRLHKKPVSELSVEQRTIRQYIHKYKPKKGDTGSFKYLVFALVYGKKKRVLRVRALRRKELYWSFVESTLKAIRQELKFECALLDRGFYVAELVDQLQKEDIPFIIRARLCDEMKKIFGIYNQWKQYDYAIADWAWTRLILGKDFKGRQWGFITNLELTKLEDTRHTYKKRWNIENIFKATDGIQLRVATNNHTTRLFCVCLSFLIYNTWQNQNKKPTLLDHIKQLAEALLTLILNICPYRDKFKLNIPFWQYIQT